MNADSGACVQLARIAALDASVRVSAAASANVIASPGLFIRLFAATNGWSQRDPVLEQASRPRSIVSTAPFILKFTKTLPATTRPLDALITVLARELG